MAGVPNEELVMQGLEQFIRDRFTAEFGNDWSVDRRFP